MLFPKALLFGLSTMLNKMGVSKFRSDNLEKKGWGEELSPGAMRDHDISKGIVIRPFNHAQQNGYLNILIG